MEILINAEKKNGGKKMGVNGKRPLIIHTIRKDGPFLLVWRQNTSQ